MTLPDSPDRYPGASTEYLIRAIMARLTAVLGEPVLEDEKSITITRAYFDPADYDTELPGVFVRALGASQDTSDGGELRTASVEIAFGMNAREYGDDEFSLSVMDRISQALLSERIIDGRYRLILPLSWASPGMDQQPWPYWFSVMQATFALPAISDITESFEL